MSANEKNLPTDSRGFSLESTTKQAYRGPLNGPDSAGYSWLHTPAWFMYSFARGIFLFNNRHASNTWEINGPDSYQAGKSVEKPPEHIQARDERNFPKQEFKTSPKYTFSGAERETMEATHKLHARTFQGPQMGHYDLGAWPLMAWDALYRPLAVLGLLGMRNMTNYSSRGDNDSSKHEAWLTKSLYAAPGQNTPAHPAIAPSTAREACGDVRTDKFTFPAIREHGRDRGHDYLEKGWKHENTRRQQMKEKVVGFQDTEKVPAGGSIYMAGGLTPGMNHNQGVAKSEAK